MPKPKCIRTEVHVQAGLHSAGTHKSKSRPTKQQQLKHIVTRDECPHSLKQVLPMSGKYTYVIEDFKDTCSVQSQDTPNFEATVRINISEKQHADQWLDEFMSDSKCTYRVTKTTKPTLKRVQAKYTMHCQHFRKALSQKQKNAQLCAHKSSKKNPLAFDIRNKKTNCPSKLTLTINVPTQRKQLNSYMHSHTAVLKLDFCHNHAVHSAHSLSFRPISESTRDKIFTLFSKGHSAASARHAYETELLLQSIEDSSKVQRILADRCNNPAVQDYSRLYAKWREMEMGHDNGPNMFSQLKTEIESYNSQNHGRAQLQIYDNPGSESNNDSSDNDEKPPPVKKIKLKKKKSKIQPMVLAICTPLMVRAHQNLQQAGEMFFCDSTSSLDRFNTSVFILSTATPTSGIPLGVILTSDEQQSTIRRGLQVLGNVIPPPKMPLIEGVLN